MARCDLSCDVLILTNQYTNAKRFAKEHNFKVPLPPKDNKPRSNKFVKTVFRSRPRLASQTSGTASYPPPRPTISFIIKPCMKVTNSTQTSAHPSCEQTDVSTMHPSHGGNFGILPGFSQSSSLNYVTSPPSQLIGRSHTGVVNEAPHFSASTSAPNYPLMGQQCPSSMRPEDPNFTQNMGFTNPSSSFDNPSCNFTLAHSSPDAALSNAPSSSRYEQRSVSAPPHQSTRFTYPPGMSFSKEMESLSSYLSESPEIKAICTHAVLNQIKTQPAQLTTKNNLISNTKTEMGPNLTPIILQIQPIVHHVQPLPNPPIPTQAVTNEHKNKEAKTRKRAPANKLRPREHKKSSSAPSPAEKSPNSTKQSPTQPVPIPRQTKEITRPNPNTPCPGQVPGNRTFPFVSEFGMAPNKGKIETPPSHPTRPNLTPPNTENSLAPEYRHRQHLLTATSNPRARQVRASNEYAYSPPSTLDVKTQSSLTVNHQFPPNIRNSMSPEFDFQQIQSPRQAPGRDSSDSGCDTPNTLDPNNRTNSTSSSVVDPHVTPPNSEKAKSPGYEDHQKTISSTLIGPKVRKVQRTLSNESGYDSSSSSSSSSSGSNSRRSSRSSNRSCSPLSVDISEIVQCCMNSSAYPISPEDSWYPNRKDDDLVSTNGYTYEELLRTIPEIAEFVANLESRFDGVLE